MHGDMSGSIVERIILENPKGKRLLGRATTSLEIITSYNDFVIIINIYYNKPF